MDSNIKNIIFDWGGVLIDITMDRFLDTCVKYGLSVTSDEITGSHKGGLYLDYETGLISDSEFRDGIRNHIYKDTDNNTNVNTLSDKEIDDIWNSMIENIPLRKLELLFDLSRKYNLYILSNTNAIHWNYASDRVFQYNNINLKKIFKKIFLSYEMHLVKPDKEIFLEALKEGKMKAEETLFIDDSKANCDAAESVGINTYHYKIGEDLYEIFK